MTKNDHLSWGLGIEHEMFFGYDFKHQQDSTTVIDSVRIVEQANIKYIRTCFDKLDASIPLKIPRLFERAAGATTAVVLSSALLNDAYLGILSKIVATEKDVLAMLTSSKMMTSHDAKCIISTIAPYITNCLDSLFWTLIGINDDQALFQLMNAELMSGSNNEVIRLFNLLYLDSINGPLVVLSKVLFGSSDVCQLLAQIYYILTKHMSKALANESHPGAYVFGRLRMRMPAITLSKKGSSIAIHSDKIKEDIVRGVETREVDVTTMNKNSQGKRLLVAAVIRLLQLQIDIDQCEWINYDVPFAEVKTLKHANVTVRSLLRELNSAHVLARSLASSLVNKTDPSVAHELPFSGYNDVLIIDPLFKSKGADIYKDKLIPALPGVKYAGSYHFWFTLPHKKAINKGFVDDHVHFALVLQWLEPLLLACCGGDPSAIGRGSAAPRAAFRATLNTLGGIGTTNVCSVLSSTLRAIPAGYPLVYFESDAAFKQHFLTAPFADSKTTPRLKVLDNPHSRTELYVDLKDGQEHLILGCEEVARLPRVGSLVGMSVDSPAPPTIVQFLPKLPQSHTPHNQILRVAYDAPFKIQDGSDVRILDDWCKAFRMHLQPFWQAFPVNSSSEKGTKVLKLRFWNPFTREISLTAPLSTPTLYGNNDNAVIGFEFRLMDNMPIEAVEPLMNLFVLAASASHEVQKKRRKCVRPHTSSAWSRTVADVIVRGKFAMPDARYMKKLSLLLGLEPIKTRKNAFESLQHIASELLATYSKHHWVHLMAPHLEIAGNITIVDTNMAAWIYAFERHLRENTETAERVKGMVEQSLNKDAQDYEKLVKFVLGERYEYDVPYIAAYIRYVCEKLGNDSRDKNKVNAFFISSLKQRHS